MLAEFSPKIQVSTSQYQASTECQPNLINPRRSFTPENEIGVAPDRLNAANQKLSTCTQVSYPYSKIDLDGYNSCFALHQRSLQKPKLTEWSVVYDQKKSCYQVWIGDRCLQEEASSYEEGERIAQEHLAQELWVGNQELVLA